MTEKVIKRARLNGSEVTTLVQDGLQIPGSTKQMVSVTVANESNCTG